ncbi:MULTISPECIES: bifunctional DedA family/phosphatase PAP2 family protein [Burkholderia]|uniref:Phosphatase PAP2 family protein n=1 Tax=Burkholderia contaminans TaxID=488447 RepID=A0A3N8QED7_9BURK|nr:MULTISPECIES: bifunctional DedA family/phosphatase PAP2 family protein [Burkholderia]MDD1494070.1 phosphatase PAP2 family protein [Burkholderia thailandensis]RQT22142.1 phosphatase PAP2 family protein [Burkholderia contaminans]
MHAWLNSIGSHPYWVLAIVFGVACAESLAVVGTLVPAGIVMFAAGALIGAGALNGWATLAVAALGAMAGDGISYEIGHRYHSEVRAWWVARGHEAAYERGEHFVEQHGGQSIVLARFFAPVRAIVPLIVGVAHMPRRMFYPINIASALAWSPAHIGPGMLFGASAQLAEAVSGRLAAMLVLLAGLLWLVVRLTRFGLRRGLPLIKVAASMAVRRLGRRHPRLAGRISAIVDPGKPDSQTRLVLVLLFIGSVWLFLGILQDVVAHDPLVRADTALYIFLQSLRTVPTDRLMAAIVEFSRFGVGLFVAAGVLFWLIARRCWHAAGYWILAVGIAAVLSPVIAPGLGYVRPFDWQPGTVHAPLPSGDAVYSVLVYGFLGWLLARRQPPLWRSIVVVAITTWIMMAGFARLYLGENWLADVLGGWSLGLAWFAVLAGTYTYRQVHDDVQPGILAAIVIGLLAIFGPWTSHERFQADLARYAPATRPTIITQSQWTEGAWRELPERRTEISGDEEEPLPLQWAARSDVIEHRLEAAGWQTPAAWSARSSLLWLSPQTSVEALPVLPKLAQGENAGLTFVKFDPQRPMSRLVLRLWRSRYELMTGDTCGGMINPPIWYGALYQEVFHRPWQLVTIATVTWPDAPAIPGLLPAGMLLSSRSATEGGSLRHAVLGLPAASAIPSR